MFFSSAIDEVASVTAMTIPANIKPISAISDLNDNRKPIQVLL